MKALAFLLFFAAAGIASAQDPCACSGTDPSGQYRTTVKHRKTYSDYPKPSQRITPQTIISWQSLYDSKTQDVNRGKINLGKISGTPEDTLYTLEGYIYYVKLEEDCDFHIEVGPADNTAHRAAVEVTEDYCCIRQKLIDRLSQYFKDKGKKVPKSYTTGREFPEGIKVTFKGLGFYDGWHGPDQHGRILTHGSSWELHPIVDIWFE
jgi:hypothetical protein